MRKEIKEIKENKEIVNKDLSSLDKSKRILLFLLEVNKNKNLSNKEVESLYLNKYKLSEKSNQVNIRVLERFLFIKNKNIETKDLNERKEILIKALSKVNIDYKTLITSFTEIKEKLKRSNKNNYNNNFTEIKDLL